MFEEYDINELQEKALYCEGEHAAALQQELANRLRDGIGIEARSKDAKEWEALAKKTKASALAAQAKATPKPAASAPVIPAASAAPAAPAPTEQKEDVIALAIAARQAEDAALQNTPTGLLYTKVMCGDEWARYWYAQYIYKNGNESNAVNEWQTAEKALLANRVQVPQPQLLLWRVQCMLAQSYLLGTGTLQDRTRGTALAQALLQQHEDAALRNLL